MTSLRPHISRFTPVHRVAFLIVSAFLLFLSSQASGARLVIEMDTANEEVEENIRAYIGSLGERDEASLRRFSSHARDQARKGMRALGYYHGRVRYQVIEGDPPTLRLEVTLGEPVRIRDVEIRVEGEAADFGPFQLPDRLRVREGDVLSHARYEGIKRFYRNQALRYGFFDGEFMTQRLRVEPDAGAADITIVYESGSRYRLGEVFFPEDSYFDQELLTRFVRFKPETPYNADHVIQLSQDLRGSNYFRSVAVDADPQKADVDKIPVDVELAERKPHSVNTGVGYSTDVGPRLRTAWTQHYVNEKGHRRGAEFELSEPRQNIGAFYEMPLNPPMTDTMRFTGGYQNETIQDTESERITLGTQWTSMLDVGWQQVVSLRREDDRFRAGDEPRRRTLLVLPGLGYTRLIRDNPTNPNRGYRLQLETSGSHRDAFSDVDVLNVQLQARGLITVRGGHRFLVRAEVGAVGTNDFSRVPPSLRFFAGGDQSVRGYAYQSLSPVDDDGNVIGGRFKIANSAEYQYPLTETWRAAFFVDQGNAFDTLGDSLKTGVGVGIRWVSPVGPLRLDVARALDSPDNFRLHFSMGPEL